MKRNFISLAVLIIAVILIVWLYRVVHSPYLSPYVTVISDSSVGKYQGTPYFTDNNGPMISLDLGKISGLTKAEADSRQVKFYSTGDGAYALLWGMPYGPDAKVRVIDVKKQTVVRFQFPETPAYVVDYIWQGDNLLLHYYSAGGLVAGGGLYADTPRQDHYYYLNPATGQFSPISVDSATSQYTDKAYNVYFSKESDASRNFVVGYCEKKDWEGLGCLAYGFSVSNGVSIKYLFDIKGEFTWGWNGSNFFVVDGTKVYLVDFSKISW